MSETNTSSLLSLEGLLANEANLPPVQNWHPQHTGQIDITIRRDGSWWHEGREIVRAELVKLFSGVLRLDDGEYFLVTPAEKLKIEVQDAPFLIVELVVLKDDNQRQLLIFRSNVGDNIILGEKNHLQLDIDPSTGEPSPYIHVRHGLNALISRPVYYELVELGKLQNDEMIISSGADDFSLGSILDL